MSKDITSIRRMTTDEWVDYLIDIKPPKKDEYNHMRAILKAQKTYQETLEQYGLIPKGVIITHYPDWNEQFEL